MKKVLVVSVALCAVLIGFGCAKFGTPKDSAILVNGKAITKTEINRVADMFEKNMMRNSPQQALAGIPPSFRKDVAKQLISNELLVQEALKRKIGYDSLAARSMFEKLKSRFPDEATFKTEMEKAGQTEDAIHKDIINSLVVDSLLKTLKKSIPEVTDTVCLAYYDTNVVKNSGTKKFRASHILLLTNTVANEAAKTALRQKAETIATQAKSGKNFDALAKANSQDPGSKDKGGDIGWFKNGELMKSFEAAVTTMKIGDISDVVESEAGFHIIKKTDEKTDNPPAFDSVKVRIRQYLESRQQQDFIVNMIDSLMKTSTIKYVDTSFRPVVIADSLKKK